MTWHLPFQPSLLPQPPSRPFSGTKRLLSLGLCHSALNLCWLFLSGRANSSDPLLFIVIFWSLNKVYTKIHFLTLFAACRGKGRNRCIYLFLWKFCFCLLTVWPLNVSSLSLLSLNLLLPPAIAGRDHIYTVDADTANGDEIFFTKVSETSDSLRMVCSQRVAIDSITPITSLCVWTWAYACLRARACWYTYPPDRQR